MADAGWTRVEKLFDGALERLPSEREAWLTEQCAGDASLRSEVERLLVAHERRGVLDFTPIVRASLDERLARALAGRYTIDRELGVGGMSTVFLAVETKHERRVVIKVLNPDLAAWWGGDRFLREIRIAARLAHPHIVGLIDSGEADGLLYYVMPYVEGETLRTRIDRAGPMPVSRVIVLLRDIASALAHAHAEGVIHRDLKPSNVLCTGDHAFLMDFGVAKLMEPGTGQFNITGMGVAVGTPAYMAPEQIRADATVDHRIDLWAWGLLAIEMLAGWLPNIDPFADPNADRSAAALSVLRRVEVPRVLSESIEQCLATSPADRPASAEVLVERMERISTGEMPIGERVRDVAYAARSRRVLLGVGLVALAATALGVWRAQSDTAAAAVAVPMPIAVATLANETGDPALDYWGRLAGDWITQGLQETGLAAVVPWPTARQASEHARSERAAGRAGNPVAVIRSETGAGTVVMGAYYLVGDSLQFRVEVIDARAGRLLGAPPTVTAPRDSAHVAIRTLRDRLMGSVAIWSDERFANVPGVARRPPRFDAYIAFDRALERYNAQDYRGAAPDLRAAYALDTTFLVPLVQAAGAYVNTGERARADTVLAILRQRRAELSEYHRHIAEALEAALASDGERYVASLGRAVAIAPGSRAVYNLAMALISIDRPDSARVLLESLDPDRGEMRGWSSYWTQLTHARHLTGEHELEVDAARELRRRFPERRVGIVLEARALAALGWHSALDSLIDSTLALPPTTYWSQGATMIVAGEELLAHGDSARGIPWLERGRSWLERQLAMDPTHTGHRYWLGSAQYDLGQWRDAASHFEALAKDDPDDQSNHGLAALAIARAEGVEAGERRFAAAPAHDLGEHFVVRARLAAIGGDHERAESLLADAVRHGVGGMAWLHASARPELRLMEQARVAVPASLRAPR